MPDRRGRAGSRHALPGAAPPGPLPCAKGALAVADLRLGMVGLDTSHVVAFAQLLHDPSHPYHVPGGRVVVAFPGGSTAFALSRTRVQRFTEEMRDRHGVVIVDSIEEVAERADAILLESVDGRQHREQFERLAPFRKPVFVDKPFATSLADARAMLAAARAHGTPVFSASSLRFATAIRQAAGGARVLGCVGYGPAELREDFPGYFWYGIHVVEILYGHLGTGCREVSVAAAPEADVLRGVWRDGRVGAAYGYRLPGLSEFGCVVFTPEGTRHASDRDGPPPYHGLLTEMLRFFRTGEPPVPPEETLEVVAFLEAADASRVGGRPVPLPDLDAPR
jgi:predicted dehydrogenase